MNQEQKVINNLELQTKTLQSLKIIEEKKKGKKKTVRFSDEINENKNSKKRTFFNTNISSTSHNVLPIPSFQDQYSWRTQKYETNKNSINDYSLTNISTLSSYLKKYECHGEYEQYQTNVELVIDDYSVILPELPADPPPLTRMPSVHIKYT